MKVPEDWTLFNSAGAVVGEGLSWDEICDSMTSYRLERGWTAVIVVNKENFNEQED